MPRPHAPRLCGVAFVGPDMVVGGTGLAAYEAARGPLPFLCDGNHILLRPEGATLRIGTDVAGYRHLFYWRDGAAWAVGESFLGLVAHLRGRGVALEEDPVHSAAWLSRRQLFQQLTTRRTAVRGISLLARDAVLTVGPEGPSIAHHPCRRAERHEDALRAFLETWLARCLALHRSGDLQMAYHLSGGLDSRAVAAFRVHLERVFGPLPGAGFRSLDNDGHRAEMPSPNGSPIPPVCRSTGWCGGAAYPFRRIASSPGGSGTRSAHTRPCA
jgi:hypothetical protein